MAFSGYREKNTSRHDPEMMYQSKQSVDAYTSANTFCGLPPFLPHIQSVNQHAQMNNGFSGMVPAVNDTEVVAVSSLAFSNRQSNSLYIAGHTTCITNRKRRNATYSTISTAYEQRASMLARHTFPDGALYSSCAGHSEASLEVLNTLSTCLYGCSVSSNTMNMSSYQNKIPPHAYFPPHGNARPLPLPSSQMGITKILPFEVSKFGGHDTVECICSISPSGICIHSDGNSKLCENRIEGMIAGTFHPSHDEFNETMMSSYATHVTVGGVGKSNLHSIDLYSSDLRSVAAHTLTSNNDTIICVEDLATNYAKNSFIAGCSDGSLRIFDGTWRKGGKFMECARIEAHGGGVSKVAVYENMICTTGYASRNSSNLSRSYVFPDQHIMIFDIRFLGRGGIAQPTLYAPRFISFLSRGTDKNERQRILIGSGQRKTGLQIITPFTSDLEDFTEQIQPPLDQDESITAMVVKKQNMAVGTSYGNIFPYNSAEIKSIPESEEESISTFSNSNYSTYRTKTYFVLNTKETEDEKNRLTPPHHLYTPEVSVRPDILRKNLNSDEEDSNVCHDSIFNSYVFQQQPMVTFENESDEVYTTSVGNFNAVLKSSSKRILSKTLNDIVSGHLSCDIFSIVPTEKLGCNLFRSKKSTDTNPNKLLVGKKIPYSFYGMESDPRKKEERRHDVVSNGSILYCFVVSLTYFNVLPNQPEISLQ